MRGICGTYEGYSIRMNGFGGENVKQTDHLQDRDVDVYDIKMDLNATGQESLDWIYLILDKGTWRAVVNTVMNIQVLKIPRIY